MVWEIPTHGIPVTNPIAAISSTNWTIGEFLFHAFKTKDEEGDTVHRGGNHTMAISQFLKGKTLYGPAKILDAWL
jgi:hypothetical protein